MPSICTWSSTSLSTSTASYCTCGGFILYLWQLHTVLVAALYCTCGSSILYLWQLHTVLVAALCCACGSFILYSWCLHTVLVVPSYCTCCSFILSLAEREDAVVVSNDNFREFNDKFGDIIGKRCFGCIFLYYFVYLIP